jgi:DNA-binding transcriptional regulator YiaG
MASRHGVRIVAPTPDVGNDFEMSPDDIKALRERHGLTARALGEILQIETDPSRFVRYLETGERPIRGPIRVLLEMLQRDELPARYLKVEPMKKRGRPPKAK